VDNAVHTLWITLWTKAATCG